MGDSTSFAAKCSYGERRLRRNPPLEAFVTEGEYGLLLPLIEVRVSRLDEMVRGSKMIKVNGKDYPWKEGLTVKQLLAEMNFTFPLIIVVINGKAIPKSEFTCTVIKNEDDIQAIHLICGG